MADNLELTYPIIKTTYQQYESHIPTLRKNLVISHRDCHPKNMLWDSQGQYFLIDWESAGLINKTKDTIATAIYWSLNADYSIN